MDLNTNIPEFGNLSRKAVLGIIAGCGAGILVLGLAFVMFLNARNSTTLKVFHKEGSVRLQDGGRSSEVFENMHLHNGDRLITDANSITKLSLDDNTYLTLREDSSVKYLKAGNKVQLEFQGGKLFFQSKNADGSNKTHLIRTPQMAMELKESSGSFDMDTDGYGSMEVTDGVISGTKKDPYTGETSSFEVRAGQRLVVYGSGAEDYSIETISEEELSDETLFSLSEDPELLSRACAQAGWNRELIETLSKERGIWSLARGPVWDLNEAYNNTGYEVAYNDEELPESDPEPAVEAQPLPPVISDEIPTFDFSDIPDLSKADPESEPAPSSSSSSGSGKSSSGSSSKSGSSKKDLTGVEDMSSMIVSTSPTGVMTLTDGTEFDPVYYAAKYADAAALYGNDPNALLYHYCSMAAKGEKRYGTLAEENKALAAAKTNNTTSTKTTSTSSSSKPSGEYKSGDFTYDLDSSDMTAKLKKYDGSSSSVTVSSSISKNGYRYTIKTIDNDAFKNNKKLTKITLYDDLKTVRSNAFYGCENLETVVFKGTKSKWNDMSKESGNDYLKDAKIECSDGNINDGPYTGTVTAEGFVFTLNGSTQKATVKSYSGTDTDPAIPATVTYGKYDYTVDSLGANLFKGKTAITEVYIPSGVTSIGKDAFSGCTGLQGVAFGGTLTAWETMESGFDANGNSVLKTVSVGCKDGGKRAYTGTYSLGVYDYTLSSSTDSNGKAVYTASIDKYTGSASSLTLPKTVVKFGLTYTVDTVNKAFADNDTVRTVTLSENTKVLNGTFENFSNLGSVRLPDKVTTIGADSFKGCTLLSGIMPQSECDALKRAGKSDSQITEQIKNSKEIMLPLGVTTIGANAFSGCTGIEVLDLPKSLTSIGAGAFSGMTLTQINYTGTKAEWDALIAQVGAGNPELTSALNLSCAEDSTTPTTETSESETNTPSTTPTSGTTPSTPSSGTPEESNTSGTGNETNTTSGTGSGTDSNTSGTGSGTDSDTSGTGSGTNSNTSETGSGTDINTSGDSGASSQQSSENEGSAG